MGLQKIFSLTSLIMSTSMLVYMILGLNGVPVYNLLGVFGEFFGIPLYLLIAISFFYTGYKWLNNMNKDNFRYFVYSCISGVLVVGSILILMIELSRVMENF